MSKTENIELQEDLQAEDFDTLRNKVADQLAELSAVIERPSGFKASSGSFESSEVDFQSSGWLWKLIQVHEWLHPSEE